MQNKPMDIERFDGRPEAARPADARVSVALWLCGVAFFAGVFVQPGEAHGMAHDGLVYLDDHWAWFPKPWRVLSSGDEN